MPFRHTRIIRFSDTDAAGVVYFANVLSICHEAYEASLAAIGINLKSFFTNPAVAIPIVHARVDFFRPLFCGDELIIELIPTAIEEDIFEIAYEIFAASTPAERSRAKAVTKHVCIDPTDRTKQPLPQEMMQWLHRWSK